MVTVKKLVNSDRRSGMTLGNHKVIQNSIDNYSEYIYHWTVICRADHNLKLFAVDASWGSQSTTRACNAYRREFLSMGYTETVMDIVQNGGMLEVAR